LDHLGGIAAGGLITAFLIFVCTIIEHVSVIERYSLRSRLPGLAMNLVQGPLTILLAWPLNIFWQSLSIGKSIRIPLWTWLEPLGVVGYALQLLALIMLADFLTYWRHRLSCTRPTTSDTRCRYASHWPSSPFR
jgi:sterol desaturase/sphingolipid hydroxylase (fatty acid hydroxylase superfamily)